MENKVRPILPLEYCSVSRAARLLGCEVEDIGHWIQVKAIKPYFQFKHSDLFEDGQKTLYSVKSSGLERETAERLQHLDCPITTKLCAFYSEGSHIEPVEYEDGVYEVYFTGTPKGIWEVADGFELWEGILDLPMEGDGGVVMYSTPWALEEVSWMLSYPSKVSLESIVILKEDLLKLHRSIELGSEIEPLDNCINNEQVAHYHRQLEEFRKQETLHKPRKPRTEPKQSHMIKALIESNDELGVEVLAKPSVAHNIITKYLSDKGVDFPQIDERTMTNWLKKIK